MSIYEIFVVKCNITDKVYLYKYLMDGKEKPDILEYVRESKENFMKLQESLINYGNVFHKAIWTGITGNKEKCDRLIKNKIKDMLLSNN